MQSPLVHGTNTLTITWEKNLNHFRNATAWAKWKVSHDNVTKSPTATPIKQLS